MRFVDAVEVRRVLTFPILSAALEAAHGRMKMGFKTGSSAAGFFVRRAVDCSRGLGATNKTGAIRGDLDRSGSN